MSNPSATADNLSLLMELERWVLPPTDERLLLPIQRQRKTSNLNDRPMDRLNGVMYRLQFCDHLRILQSLYGDSEDQQRLISEWRENRDDAKVTMSMKVLQDKLLEGRCRVMALCRMCYGEESLESVRALVDLAGANALLELWVPMQEQLTIATSKLTHLSSPTEVLQRAYRRRKSYHAASLVDCCYRILREHALTQRGQVTPMYVRQLDEGLKNVRTKGLEDIALLKEMNPDQDYDDEYDFIVTPNQIKEIITEVYTFIERYMHDKKKPSSTFRSISPTNGRISPDLIPLKPPHKTYPSWGDMISFLRTDCEVVLFWIDEMQLGSLPQDISALHLSFRVCDEQNRGIAHPMQLSQTIVQFPNALKAMTHTSLRSYLEHTKVILHPTNPSYQPILSTHPTNPSYQPILSTHPFNTSYQPILSTHPINPSYQPILSTHPINPSYQPILSTHPINPSYQHKLPTHPTNPSHQPILSIPFITTHLTSNSPHSINTPSEFTQSFHLYNQPYPPPTNLSLSHEGGGSFVGGPTNRSRDGYINRKVGIVFVLDLVTHISFMCVYI